MDVKALVFGELAVKSGTITASQLDEALQQQIDERYQRPLGVILVEKGFVTEEALNQLLARQQQEIVAFERTANVSRLFGRIAVERGFITEEELQSAVRSQLRQHARGGKSKIGQVLIDLEMLDLSQFWRVIHDQGDFQCGICKHTLVQPLFMGRTILCENCKSPVFAVTPEKPGPRPTKRRVRK